MVRIAATGRGKLNTNSENGSECACRVFWFHSSDDDDECTLADMLLVSFSLAIQSSGALLSLIVATCWSKDILSRDDIDLGK